MSDAPAVVYGFCTLSQAVACAVDEKDAVDLFGQDDLLVVNVATGESFLCDARIAHGYVAACRLLWPAQRFDLRCDGRPVQVLRHHNSSDRLANPDWAQEESSLLVEAALFHDFADSCFDPEDD